MFDLVTTNAHWEMCSVFNEVMPPPSQHGQQLYRHIYLGCKEEDNVHKNFELLFTTLAILTIELANEEAVIDLIRLSIAIQVTPLLPQTSLM